MGLVKNSGYKIIIKTPDNFCYYSDKPVAGCKRKRL